MQQSQVRPDERTLDETVLEEFLGAVGPRGQVLLNGIATIFFAEAPKLLAELARAVAANNVERAALLAHRLRGSSISIGANALAARCAALETSEATAASGFLRAIEAEYQHAAAALVAFLEAHSAAGTVREPPLP